MTNEPTPVTKEQERETTEQDDPRSEQMVCEECGGDLVSQDGELVCSECGLVIEDEQIDRGPEWRAFSHNEEQERSRVGSPTTEMMHDKGLSTNISWQNKDGYGNPLSSKKKQQMRRLRTWNERYKTKDSGERNLQQAFGEISRMASGLGLSKTVRETASVIYRRAHEESLIVGRSIEGGATASLYIACRKLNIPRTPDDIESVSRVDIKEINRTYRYFVRELNIEIKPSDPRGYLNQFLDELIEPGENEEHATLQRTAEDLINTAEEANIHSGRSPTSLAAAAIYAAGLLENNRFTQREVSKASGVTEVTIRNRYQEMLDEYIDM